MAQELKLIQKSFKHGLLPRGKTFSGKTHFKVKTEDDVKINTIRGLIVLKIHDQKMYQVHIQTAIE